MPRIAVSTPQAPSPAGPYSQGVRIGNLVAVAGQVGMTPDGVTMSGIERQTRQALENLLAILGAAGAGFENVIQVRVFLTDPGQFAPMNAVYQEYFKTPAPARTTVYVSLPRDLLVEVDVLAVLGG